MTCKSLVAMTLLAGCSPAFAAQQIAPVQVTAAPEFQLEFACANPARPTPAQVIQLLDIRDAGKTQQLGRQLMRVVDKACDAGYSMIAVHRTTTGNRLVWEPLPDAAVRVAAN